MNWKKSIAPALFLITAFSACTKNPTSPAADKKIIGVKLTGYMQGIQVDSAVATWTKGTETSSQKMIVRNDSLIISSSAFAAGAGELSIEIYSNKKFGQYKSIWFHSKDLVIDPNGTYVVSGPAAFFDTEWKPRVILNDAVGHEAIVALLPSDPYFKVKKPSAAVIKLVVDRSYWKLGGGIVNQGQKIWQCTGACLQTNSDIIDAEFFKPLQQQVGDKPWNHIEIGVVYEHTAQGEGYALQFTWDVS